MWIVVVCGVCGGGWGATSGWGYKRAGTPDAPVVPSHIPHHDTTTQQRERERGGGDGERKKSHKKEKKRKKESKKERKKEGGRSKEERRRRSGEKDGGKGGDGDGDGKWASKKGGLPRQMLVTLLAHHPGVVEELVLVLRALEAGACMG